MSDSSINLIPLRLV